MNHQSSLDFDEFRPSTCPQMEKIQSSLRRQKISTDLEIPCKAEKEKEKAVVIQRFANEIVKEADRMEANDKEFKKLKENMKSAADKVEKITIQMAKRGDPYDLGPFRKFS